MIPVIGLHQREVCLLEAEEGGNDRYRSPHTFALFILLMAIISPHGTCQFPRRVIIAFLAVVLQPHAVLSWARAVAMSEITLLISTSLTILPLRLHGSGS